MNEAISVSVPTESKFVQRAIAAIEETKRSGGSIPATVVIAKLETKLAAFKKHQRSSLPT